MTSVPKTISVQPRQSPTSPAPEKMEHECHQRSAAPPKEKAENKPFKDLILNFMDRTTAHGIGRLAASETIFWKIFWSLICMGAFGMFVYQVTGLFEQYLSKPIATSMSVTFEKHLSFPAVTICNLNMLRREAIPAEVADILRSGMNRTSNQTDNAGSTRRRRNSPTDNPTTDGWRTTYNPSTWHYSRHVDEYEEEYPAIETISFETKQRLQIESVIGSFDTNNISSNGHQFKTMIVDCTWKGFDCKNGNLSKFWTRQWDYNYGNCFTFNGGSSGDGKPLPVLRTTKAGPTHGLILHINVEQEKYVGLITEQAGIRVLLHQQGSMIFPFEQGFSLSPGISASVGIKKRQISRLDRFNNKSCVPVDEISTTNIYRRFKNITAYSQQACLNSCLGHSQRSLCECSETAYPSDAKPCDIFNKTTRECLKTVKYLFTNDMLHCLKDCKQPCKEELIQKTISSSEWPSQAYKEYLISEGQWDNHSDYNDLQLSVFFNELHYERIEESFSYGTINLLADIGGQLGLWIGLSVITVFELMELILMFFTVCVKKMKAGRKVEDGRVHGW